MNELDDTRVTWRRAADCIRRGDVKSLGALLDKAPDVRSHQDDRDGALLEVAFQACDWPCIERLAQTAPDLAQQSVAGRPLLMEAVICACESGREASAGLRALITNSTTPVNEIRNDDESPLHYAVRSDADIAAVLLDAGLHVNTVDSFGHTPLHLCCISDALWCSFPDRLRAIRLLIAHGANPDHRTGYGQTAFEIVENERASGELSEDERSDLVNALL